MPTPALMLQGTGSDVGKSLLVTGLARAFTRRGLRVRPFKPQNMSNNAAVTQDGGEIGRAQALQARACGAELTVHMNPILLKPESQGGAQVVVQGQRIASMEARAYFKRRQEFLPAVLESYGRLAGEADLVLVEGAGSPAEVNLRDGDIANMGFARAAGVPVVLVGDIHRGGVIASLVGSFVVIDGADADQIRAIMVNKFHGDISLFDEGVRYLEAATGRPCAGVVPHFAAAGRLPAEDSLALEQMKPDRRGRLRVAVPRLPRISNFDDLDPLKLEPDVEVLFVQPGQPIPADCQLILLPGSKSTAGDLSQLREEGWDIDILAHARRGGHVLGLCGGFQMLGRSLSDPEGLEGPAGSHAGLALLDVDTVLTPEKRLETVTGRHLASGQFFTGYEMHKGRTAGPDLARPFAEVEGRPEGACSPDGRIAGSYLHGIFAADDFRRAYLTGLGEEIAAGPSYEATVEATLDALAEHLERHLDLDLLWRIAQGEGATAEPRTQSQSL